MIKVSDKIEDMIEDEVAKRTAGYRGAIAKAVEQLQFVFETPPSVRGLPEGERNDDDPIVPPGTPEEAGAPSQKVIMAEKSRESRKNILKKTNGVEYK